MGKTIHGFTVLAAICIFGPLHSDSARGEEPAKPHPHRLPSVSIKQQVIWGSTAEAPDGTALSFGGEDRDAEDGLSHTRLRVNGEWVDLREELHKKSLREVAHDRVWALRNLQKDLLTHARHLYFEGKRDDDFPGRDSLMTRQRSIENAIGMLISDFAHDAKTDNEFAAAYPGDGGPMAGVGKTLNAGALERGVNPDSLAQMRAAQVQLEQAADQLSAEPRPVRSAQSFMNLNQNYSFFSAATIATI